MDLEQNLHELAKKERLVVGYDRAQLNRMRGNIQKQIEGKKGPSRFIALPVFVVILVIVFMGVSMEKNGIEEGSGQNILGVGVGDTSTEVEPHAKLESSPVSSERLEKIIEIMYLYEGINVKKIAVSPLIDVFVRAEEAYVLETAKGKIQVVIFPENFNAEKIEIDEDFSVSGNITYTFTGAELREERLPIKASAPTYVFGQKNTLFLTSNLQLHMKISFKLQAIHEDIMRSFGIDPDEYEYAERITYKKKNGSKVLGAKELKNISIIAIQVLMEEKGFKGFGPEVFLKKGEPKAIIIYQKTDGSNYLRQYHWLKAEEKWILEEKKSNAQSAIPSTAR